MPSPNEPEPRLHATLKWLFNAGCSDHGPAARMRRSGAFSYGLLTLAGHTDRAIDVHAIGAVTMPSPRWESRIVVLRCGCAHQPASRMVTRLSTVSEGGI